MMLITLLINHCCFSMKYWRNLVTNMDQPKISEIKNDSFFIGDLPFLSRDVCNWS